jgi:thiamine-phosphate pyrophosphorylase
MAIARRLNRAAGAPRLPPLLFLTDPSRTPDPAAAAARLPRGAAVLFRHFGAADRLAVAARLARVCGRRGLSFLIAADPSLARLTRAKGIHWPERSIAKRRPRRPLWIVTAAAHSRKGLARARLANADAVLLSPIFRSASPSAGRPLGALRASRLAAQAGLPVYALGGVTSKTARRLIGLRFAGIAAVGTLA